MSLENENKSIPSYSEFLNKGNATNVERKEYTDEEYRKMATKISQKEIGEYDNWNDIIVEALLELGAPKEILSDEVCRDTIIHTIIEKNHINKDGSVKDLTENISSDRRNVQNMENLVRTLNENLLINDNSIAGVNTRERENGFIQEMTMFSIDTNGLLKTNGVEYAMSGDKSWVRMIEDVYELDKGEREQVYHKVGAQDILKEDELNQLTIENAMQIMSIPNREFSDIIEKGQSDVFKEEKNENIVETFLSGLSEWKEGVEGRDSQKKDARSEAIENVVSMFTREEKTDTNQKSITSEDILNGEKIERIEYTDKEYERMANKVAKNTGKNMDGIAIIEQSLMQLGVPQELLQSPDYKPMIYNMVNQYLYKDNGKGEAIFGKDKQGCETVLRTLNENLVIRDNYIAGIEQIEAKGKYESAERMTELFMDENGMILENREQWNKYAKEDSCYADKTGSSKACSLDEQGKQKVLAYQEMLGGQLIASNMNQMSMNIDMVKELQGEDANLKRNEVYQEAVNKRQKEESISAENSKSQEEPIQDKEQQRGKGILSKLIETYDSFDITPDYLGSIKGLIKDSLDKEKEREQEEQK